MSNSPEVYLAILNAIREPLFVVSRENTVIFVNNAFWDALPADTDNGRVALPHSPWFWSEGGMGQLPYEPFSSVFVTRDGQEFAVKLRATALEGGNHLIELLDGMQGAAPSKDFHGQRLQTLGMLATGVAHDFNNILTGILGHLAYLKAATKLDGQPFESLNSIEEGAKKASDISQQIVKFSKVETSEESKTVNLSILVERTCRLLRGAISAKYQLNVSGPQDRTVNVLGIESKIAQILVNLVVNARDACEKGGTISVSVKEINDPAKLSSLLSTDELPCNSYAVLSVEDSGHGMPPEILERIFEPYFSTKAENGTGIGLFTVLNIVKGFGGAIEVESAIGKGTSVNIYLPQMAVASSQAAVTQGTENSKPAIQTAKNSILVVDDEYTVRNVLNLALQHLGFDVTIASSGLEAIAKYKERKNGFDLVLLDMLMPNMSGENTFVRLKEVDPAVKVLIISGYTSEEAIKTVLEGGGLGFIQKPFTIEALAARIQECLV